VTAAIYCILMWFSLYSSVLVVSNASRFTPVSTIRLIYHLNRQTSTSASISE